MIYRIECRYFLSGDDDYSQFDDYNSYGTEEDEEEERFSFESNFEKNQLSEEQEKPATSFSLADGFPEVRGCNL